jgi:murein DD-endopeptidase MepM/ murein hydrolase activator NlpD
MDGSSIGNLGKSSLSNALTEKALALKDKAPSADARQREKVAQEFASFLYLEVIKAMRATLSQDGFVETESLSRDIYTSMMDGEVARAMAKRDGTGFTKTVEKSLEKMAPAARPVGDQAMPADGVVSSTFGTRVDPINGMEAFHHGVDIAAPVGTEIRAAAAGRVISSGWVAGYGNMVEVDHGGGLVTRYGHNSRNLVAVGEDIQAGQAIALVGSTGRATGAHVHFEVRKLGKPVNPESLLGDLSKGTKIRSVA